MATLAEVQGDIAVLQAAVTEANAKMDDIAALVASLRAGGGASEADLEGLRLSLSSVSATMVEIASKQTAILA